MGVPGPCVPPVAAPPRHGLQRAKEENVGAWVGEAYGLNLNIPHPFCPGRFHFSRCAVISLCRRRGKGQCWPHLPWTLPSGPPDNQQDHPCWLGPQSQKKPQAHLDLHSDPAPILPLSPALFVQLARALPLPCTSYYGHVYFWKKMRNIWKMGYQTSYILFHQEPSWQEP